MRPAAKLQDPMPETRLTVLRPARSIGRPIVHTEPWSKITVVMNEHHVLFLDLVGLYIRARHRRTLPRAQIVLALVEFMQRSEIDFSRFATVDEMTEYLTDYFRAIPNGGQMPLLESSLFSSTRAGDVRRGGREIHHQR